MSADQLAGYRAAKEAQWERFERSVQGRDRTDTGTPEFREYFGLGEYAGGGVESPLTFKSYLIGSRQDRPATPAAPQSVALVTVEGAFWLSGKDLAQLAAAGCPVAASEVQRRAVKRAAKRRTALTGELSRWERVTA